MLDVASDRFDCAVLASDHEAEPPYGTRIETYRGVPVYRIAPPREIHMDWRPFNGSMQRPVANILDRFEPDLVHVHCIQRLTATVVEATRARGIPYIVTLHDAWWISDFLFLMDQDDEVRLPTDDALTSPVDPAHGAIASLSRRRRLGRLLDGAAARIAVSDTFADLYRRAGCPDTIAIPNGVSDLDLKPRRASSSGRIRLGHIGGRSAHKGATLIEMVLRGAPFRNLSLTMIDGAAEPGSVREQLWGTTPVKIVGPVRQTEIADLYADLDVLLAPSLWPESFGLVTREAAAARLWVVASDRGAVGESVVDDVNGYRVDVSSTAGLRATLQRIDADPNRFLGLPPLPETPIRPHETRATT